MYELSEGERGRHEDGLRARAHSHVMLSEAIAVMAP